MCAAHSSCLLQEHPLEEPMLGKVSRSLQMEVYREVDRSGFVSEQPKVSKRLVEVVFFDCSTRKLGDHG